MGTAFSDRWGGPLRAGTRAGVAHFDRSVADLVRLGGDPVAHAEAAVAADPELVLARLLLAYFGLYATTSDGRATAGEVMADLETDAPPLGEREVLHLRAVRAWTDGDWVGAARALERALLHDPHDLLALKVVQDLYFFLGRRTDLRDVVLRVLPAWSSADRPGWGYVQGILAFGLEENGDYRAAEDHARAALAASADDVWATHALAHVYEMEGDPPAGEMFLSGTAADWSPSFFAVHNWWHLALFHLELGRIDTVLELYDGPIRSARSTEWVHLVDAAALLWRLTLFGVDVTERAVRLADDIEPRLGPSIYLFNDWHAVMALGLAGRHATVDQVIAEVRHSAVGTNRTVVDEVGALLLEGFAAVAAGRVGRAVDLLVQARPRSLALGGSNAQRDIIDLTLVAAGARAGSRHLVDELVAARVGNRPSTADAVGSLVAANSL